jgi:acyl-CoA thioesterase YciA
MRNLAPLQQPDQKWALYDRHTHDFVRLNAPRSVVETALKSLMGISSAAARAEADRADLHEDWWADAVADSVEAHGPRAAGILDTLLADGRHTHNEMGLIARTQTVHLSVNGPEPEPMRNPCAEISLQPCVLGSRHIAIREILMPKDLNHHGVAFGGWVLSKIDLAGAVEARRHTQHDVVTRFMNGIEFTHPVKVGDQVTFYTSLVCIGNTSITVKVEIEASRDGKDAPIAVTAAEIVYVTVKRDATGNIHKVPVKG